MHKRILFLILLCVNVQLTHSQNWDINTLEHINVHRRQSYDGTFRTISNTTITIVLGGPSVLFIAGWVAHDSAARHNALNIGGSVILSVALSEISKRIVKRDRPFITYGQIENLQSPTGYSFPSSHTSPAFALATSVSIAYPKWYIIAPSFVWAGAVGYSRMHLGVHFPTDVIAGAFLGAGSAYLSGKINTWLFYRKNKPQLN